MSRFSGVVGPVPHSGRRVAAAYPASSSPRTGLAASASSVAYLSSYSYIVSVVTGLAMVAFIGGIGARLMGAPPLPEPS